MPKSYAIYIEFKRFYSGETKHGFYHVNGNVLIHSDKKHLERTILETIQPADQYEVVKIVEILGINDHYNHPNYASPRS